MKWLLAILCAVSINAFADSWAIPNKSGGEIVITTRECPRDKRLLRAYNYGTTGQMIEGCWAVLDDRVQIVDRKSTRLNSSHT